MKNTNQGIVLLASAIVILSGALCLGMAGLIEAISPHRGLGHGAECNFAGIGLLFLGGATFLLTYLRKKE
jgi:hypothetical protein